MKTIIKKILLVYISIVLALMPSSVFAVSAGGWAFSSFDVAKNLVTAMKNGASASVAVAKSPITTKIAKGIVGGAIAGAAIPLAISQLTGIALDAVDWVLDPANNAIKYKKKIDPNNPYDYHSGATGKSYSTPELACDYLKAVNNGAGITGASFSHVDLQKGLCYYNFNGEVEAWSSFTTAPITPKSGSISIPTVANKVYDNAKTDSNSRSVVNDSVRDYVNEGTADTALDNAKADADATNKCGTGTHWSGSACVADTPSTPSTPTTPDTPFDPSSIIDAINSVFNAITDLFDAVMSIPDVINTAIDKVLDAIESITDVINTAIDDLFVDIKDFFQPMIDKFNDFVDWVKQEPPQDEPPRNVPVGQLSDVGLENQDRFQARIKFPSQCPSQQLTFNYFGRTYSHEIPFQALCQVLEMVAPIFVGVACLGVAFYIVREV